MNHAQAEARWIELLAIMNQNLVIRPDEFEELEQFYQNGLMPANLEQTWANRLAILVEYMEE